MATRTCWNCGTEEDLAKVCSAESVVGTSCRAAGIAELDFGRGARICTDCYETYHSDPSTGIYKPQPHGTKYVKKAGSPWWETPFE